MVAATLEKILRPPMPKRSNDSCLQENQEKSTTCTLSVTCQSDIVNKKLVLQLNWNNLFSKTYWRLTLTCRCRGKIYSHVKNNFIYTLLIYSFYILFCLTKQIPRNVLGCLLIFLNKWYSIDILCLSNVYVKNWYIYLK